ncbi:MAG: glucose-6-phosphate dehydrogenase [Xanthomonadales bacterium]|nr:glucose-6-phosphate dehydrogenase [Xanthomonadales bacterium]
MARFVPVDPFDIVIFGGTGDLARRKLLPALYHRDKDRQLPGESQIIGSSRQSLTTEAYRESVEENLRKYLGPDELVPDVVERFLGRIHYAQVDLADDRPWDELKSLLAEHRTRVLYLATIPSLYGNAAERAAAEGVITDRTRIVLEKPVGQNLESAQEINAHVGRYFSESQIYRIDHYLGKETVQNLLALRFGNSLFEPLWQRAHVDHVQITVAESLGVGERSGFYDRTGALKDMVQNHLVQLLCLVAMEAPTSMDHEQIRDEKIKVLKALRPIGVTDVEALTVRGQYSAGTVDGESVPGYANEVGEATDTETFVAIKAHIDNWRWAGVPFYLRTGKRLAHKTSEVVIQFRPVAHSIFDEETGPLSANRLVIRLQPNEGVTLSLMTKDPGPGGFHLRSLPLDLSFAQHDQVRYPDAYERLLMEVLRGNPALFMRDDEVEAAWRWIDGILAAWDRAGLKVNPYQAGSFGPMRSEMLLDRDGRSWHV